MTFSILALDEKTWRFGWWVCTHWYKCSNVISQKPWIWIVATQWQTNNNFSKLWLEFLSVWNSAKESVEKCLATDKDFYFRQLAILSSNGEYFQFSWSACISEVCEYRWKNFCVQANIMANSSIAEAVWKSYEKNQSLDFEYRILEALKSWQKAWWDIRWEQSCALLIWTSWENILEWEDEIKFSVDDNPQPLKELERLLWVHKAYKYMLEADNYIWIWEYEKALDIYNESEKILPNNLEIKFWKWVSLLNIWKENEWNKILEEVYKIWWENWRELFSRFNKINIS